MCVIVHMKGQIKYFESWILLGEKVFDVYFTFLHIFAHFVLMSKDFIMIVKLNSFFHKWTMKTATGSGSESQFRQINDPEG